MFKKFFSENVGLTLLRSSTLPILLKLGSGGNGAGGNQR